jgi:DNA-binding NarL/FixJ family response regulator
MSLPVTHILLVGNSPDRLDVLTEHLTAITGLQVILSSFDGWPEAYGGIGKKGDKVLIIMDLTHYNEALIPFIRSLTELTGESRRVALHFYESPTLVDRLVNAGLDGYIHADPDRKDLKELLEGVMYGKTVVRMNKK